MKILVDWGSSNFRAFLLKDDKVIDRVSAADGILKLFSAANQIRPPEFFSQYLADILKDWLAAHPAAPIIMCGAVGSNEGWFNIPYVAVPAGYAEIRAQLFRVPEEKKQGLAGRDIFIVPGVAERKALGFHDIMRSEETKSLGALTALGMKDALLCVPGT
ncbi:MAG: 2-dehydro-3-deoxygalactonokinase, partial [Alphaproteobacteria bacterium]|nr:2-dehydro-3-deoxygalactonokinase [Alphaproteobacteria bacterium]